MPNTFDLISSNILSSTASSVTFSSIPSTYTDLIILGSIRSTSAGTTVHDLTYRINGLTTSVYSKRQLTSNGTAAQSYAQTTTRLVFENVLNGASSTASTFGNIEIYFPSYRSSNDKPISHFGVSENNATLAAINTTAGLFADSNPITQIQFYLDVDGFAAGSSFYLYGIKNS